MHERAERGIAASWAYADAKRQGSGAMAASLASEHDIAWVQQLAHWQQGVDTPEEFFQTLRSDFFKNRIFCLTPTGEVVNLPEGATPVDFAYSIRRSLGNRVNGARVNSMRLPLDHVLANGDVVHILVGPEKQGPRREWLDFVKTNVARHSIKQWFSQLRDVESKKLGQQLIDKELKQLLGRTLESMTDQHAHEYMHQHGYQNLDQLFIAVGKGERNPRQVVKRVFAEDQLDMTVPVHRTLEVRIAGALHAQAVRARCCRPIEGDAIVALHQGKRVVIHRTECKVVNSFAHELIQAAEWVLDPLRTYRVWLEVVTETYVGMLRDVSDVCAQNNNAIHDVLVRRKDGDSSIGLLVEIRDADQLSTLIRKLRSIPKVHAVERRYS